MRDTNTRQHSSRMCTFVVSGGCMMSLPVWSGRSMFLIGESSHSGVWAGSLGSMALVPGEYGTGPGGV